VKKNLRHFEREQLIWDAQIDPKHKLILLAYNSFIGSGDFWPSVNEIAQMTGIPAREIESPGIQNIVQIWIEGLS
jgi:hypothetical protein